MQCNRTIRVAKTPDYSHTNPNVSQDLPHPSQDNLDALQNIPVIH